MEGSIIVPGLTDAHAHILQYGFKMQLMLDGCKSVQEVIDRVETFVKATPTVMNDKDVWIQGMGWDQTKWEGQRFPVADDLETPLLKGRPISLLRIDVHASWVSHKVIQLTKEKGDIPTHIDGGFVMRDSAGEPTGVFVDKAMALIPRPPVTDEERGQHFKLTMKDALAVGLTSIHDAAVDMEDMHFFIKYADMLTLNAFDSQAAAGQIRLYLMAMLPSNFEDVGSRDIPRLINYGKHGRLTLRSFKLFLDGALGSWGAALLEPYSDKPEESGLVMYTDEKVKHIVRELWNSGWQVNSHGIGDRANQMILDAYESILRNESTPSNAADIWRPRIEHAQIMTQEDLKRTGDLKVIPSVQPTHATSDMWYAEQRLGKYRIKGAYAYRTLLHGSSSKILPIGSDFPVEGVNPLLGFYAAVARSAEDGSSPHGPAGWYASEALTRAEALRGMTYAPAYASFSEHDLGSLEKGKKADFVVLDRNIMNESLPVADILRAKVKATVIDGRVAYGSL
ncbi:amidohydrolase 3 [Pterulicium gracile]|uniref:Amidohydrolase 3 n=1 Tax=Pterulicium gracile TaxID=1884261 RepID=A0A5C3Q914_9AGAR|nr:amidohydrolase 3 [Pterula gracilis]